jgi:hypothetical protein
MVSKSSDKWQFGDFQTPIDLARTVVKTLKDNHGIAPDVVIEPTCGKGAFVRASYEGFQHSKIVGFEINPLYVDEANRLLDEASAKDRAIIKRADFFNTDWAGILSDFKGFILVIGNPPWVTSSELGLLNSKNLPEKSNFQNRKGIEAITGSANFDISEWMLLQHIQWLSEREGAIAFLCKYSVARKVMRQVRQNTKHRFFGHVYPIDAKTFFGASVDACLFVLTTDAGDADFEIYEYLGASKPSRLIGERSGFIVNDLIKYEKWSHLKGQDPRYIWRSGVKHDCSKVMEMEPVNGAYINGLGEIVRCEDDFIYPLLKSSDIGNGRTKSYRKVVLITQKRVGDDTSGIKTRAARTWDYLVRHKTLLEGRRSSIYCNRPAFSVFGVGEYSFKDWKVAISGLYKQLRFSLVGPMNGKPVAFDDTVNFLAFNTEAEAAFVYRMLTSPPAIEFLEAMVFWDEKRPITTQLLRRLSIKEVARELGALEEYLKWGDAKDRERVGQLELGIAEQQIRYIEVPGS